MINKLSTLKLCNVAFLSHVRPLNHQSGYLLIYLGFARLGYSQNLIC